MWHREVRGTATMAIFDPRAELPRRQGARRFDYREVAADSVEPMFHGNAGRERQVLVSHRQQL